MEMMCVLSSARFTDLTSTQTFSADDFFFQMRTINMFEMFEMSSACMLNPAFCDIILGNSVRFPMLDGFNLFAVHLILCLISFFNKTIFSKTPS